MGWGRALQIAVPQALSNITSMQNIQMAEEQNRRAEEAFQVNKASAQMDLAKKQEEAKYKAEWLSLDDAINEYAPTSTKSVREKFKKDVTSSKLVQDINGEPKIQRMGVDRFIESKRTSREYGLEILKTQGADYRERRSEIATLLNDPESKLKPEQIQVLQAEDKEIITKQKPIDAGLAAESARVLLEAGKVTPESYSKFQQTGILSDLKQVGENKVYDIGGVGYKDIGGGQLTPVTPKSETKANLQYVGVSNDKDKAPVVFDPDTGGTFKNINGKLMPYSGQVEPKIEKQTTTIITPGQTATIAHGIRTEMRGNPVIKDFQDLVQKHNGMEEAYKASKTTKNFVAVDQALITFFNKATDPSSVVRESEYARTPENLSLVNRIKGKANKILEGGAGLTSDERTALRDMMQSFYKIYEKEYKFTVNNYKRMAKESGINPNLISIPYETRPQETDAKTIVRTGTDKKTGKKVIQYSDGSMEYAK